MGRPTSGAQRYVGQGLILDRSGLSVVHIDRERGHSVAASRWTYILETFPGTWFPWSTLFHRERKEEELKTSTKTYGKPVEKRRQLFVDYKCR